MPIGLHVEAVELVILVKPIGILTCVLMSISFGTKIPTIFLTVFKGKHISPMLSSLQKVQTLCQFQISRGRKKHSRLAQIEFKLINTLDSRAFNVDFYYSD